MSKMHFQSKKRKNSKGFYIALGVCLIAIGAAAWTTYTGVKNYLTPETPTQSAPQEAGKNVSGVTVSEPESSKEPSSAPSSSRESSSSESSSKPEKKKQESSAPSSKAESKPEAKAEEKPQQTAAAPSSYAFPSGRTVTKEFSGDNPVYSLTMNDWRVHQGTDFAAEKGSTVKTIAPGVVKDVTDDPLLGKTVVVDHGGGVVAYYCGLGDTVMVKVGDSVITAQEIGSVKSVPSECVEEPHLHLGIQKDGAWVDPMSLLDDEG